MKKALLIIMAMLPCIVFGQFKRLNLETKGLNIQINENYSESLVNLLKLGPGYSFLPDNNRKASATDGEQHLYFNEYYNGILIDHTSIALHYENSTLYYINGDYYVGNLQAASAPLRSESEAFGIALNTVHADKYIWEDPELLKQLNIKDINGQPYSRPQALLTFYMHEDRVVLAYKFDILALSPLSCDYIYIDAVSGEVLKRQSQISHGSAATRYSGTVGICTEPMPGGGFRLYETSCGKDIIHTWNAMLNNNTSFAVEFVDNDDNWTSAEYNNSAKDNAALDAHMGVEKAHDFFKNIFGRNSYNNAHGTTNIYVHYSDAPGLPWDNAGSFGSSGILIFGDGTSTDPYTPIDVVGHEFSHQMFASIGLIGTGTGENGAINEALSDIWGACIESYAIVGKQKWLMGEDMYVNPGNCIRSMKDPKTRSHPDTYQGINWISTSGGCNSSNDQCGIHANACVMDKWFYLLSDGDFGTNDNGLAYHVAGIGMTKASQIVYRAETIYMNSSVDFAQARITTLRAAADLFGECSQEVASVADAWGAVGVGSMAPAQVLTLSPPPVAVYFNSYTAYGINSTDIVVPGAVIEYKAAKYIDLLPGFHAYHPTVFLAHIAGCMGVVGAKPGHSNGNTSNIVAGSESNLQYLAENEIKLYPNPTNGAFTVEMKHTGDYTVRVVNITGSTVYELQLKNEQKKQLQLDSKLPPGTYSIHIVGQNVNYVDRLVIVK